MSALPPVPQQIGGQAQTVQIPKRVPLVAEPENRGDSPDTDARLVNCYSEKTPEGDYQIYKRPGLLEDEDLSRASAETGRGLYHWRGSVYSVFNGTLYKDGVSIGSVSNAGMYKFSATLGATQTLFLDNLTTAYQWNDSALTAVSDGDFPASRVPGSGYLDATTYVGTTLAGIYGDDPNNVLAWDPLNLILAQIEPDGGVAIAKQLVYIIMLKQWTGEVFYDAGNATGSPLGTVQGAKISFGCANGYSLQDIDDTLFWLSTTRAASPQVIMMRDLKTEVISTPAVERLLDNVSLSTVYSWTLKDEGHMFYVLTVVAANLTLAYDVRERKWWQMTDSSGNYFPVVASTYDSTLRHLVQHASNGKIYEMDRQYANDDGVTIQWDIYAPNFDGGTQRRKNCKMLTLLADRYPAAKVLCRYNDQDYDPDGWSTFQEFDLSQEKPSLTNLGTFVRRAYNFRGTSNTQMRLRAAEHQLDLGTL